MFSLSTKSIIEYQSERFQELCQLGKIQPAPHGKESALSAWKRDRRFAGWKRHQERHKIKVNDEIALLLSSAGLSSRILTFNIELLHKIWRYLAPNELGSCLIMYHVLSIYDDPARSMLIGTPLEKPLEEPGKLPKLKSQSMPLIPTEKLSAEAETEFCKLMPTKTSQAFDATIETILNTTSYDAGFALILKFSTHEHIYRALYFLLSTLINSYGPCKRRENAQSEEEKQEYVMLYNKTLLCITLIETHFPDWLDNYPSLPETINLKTLVNSHLPLAKAVLQTPTSPKQQLHANTSTAIHAHSKQGVPPKLSSTLYQSSNPKKQSAPSQRCAIC